MASDYTEGLGVELIGAGDKAGSWGDVTNNNLQALEEGISRYAEIGITTDAIASDLDIPDGTAAYSADSKGRSSVIKWTGTVAGGTHTVTLKVGGNLRTQARFTAVNGLNGSATLFISCGAGTNVTIPNGYSAVIHIDGTNVVKSLANLSVDTLISSGNITGNLQGNATSVTDGVYTSNNLSALAPGATADELRTRVTGTTGTGSLVFSIAPTLTAPALGEPTALTGTNITGTASGLTAGSVTTIPALSGDVTSSGSFNTAITLADGVVSEPKLNVSNGPTDGYILSAQSGGGGLEWIPPGTAGNVTSVTGGDGITVTNGTSASPSVAVDSTVVRTAGIQTLSQKTLSSPTITGTGNIEGSNLVGSSSVATPSLTSTGALSISPAGALSISPGFLQRIDLSSSFIDTGSGSAISLTTSSGPLLLETTNPSASSGAIKFQTKDSSNSSVVQATVNQEGIALLSSGGQYLNMNTAYGVNGFGLRGSDSSSNVLGMKNSIGDAWGQPYHASMVSGQGAFFESSVNLGSVGSGSLIANFTASEAHGLLTTPKILRCVLRCVVVDNGYAVGDEIAIDTLRDQDESSGSSTDGITYGANSTSVFVDCLGLGGVGGMLMVDRGGGALSIPTLASWDIYMYAWK